MQCIEERDRRKSSIINYLHCRLSPSYFHSFHSSPFKSIRPTSHRSFLHSPLLQSSIVSFRMETSSPSLDRGHTYLCQDLYMLDVWDVSVHACWIAMAELAHLRYHICPLAFSVQRQANQSTSCQPTSCLFCTSLCSSTAAGSRGLIR